MEREALFCVTVESGEWRERQCCDEDVSWDKDYHYKDNYYACL